MYVYWRSFAHLRRIHFKMNEKFNECRCHRTITPITLAKKVYQFMKSNESTCRVCACVRECVCIHMYVSMHVYSVDHSRRLPYLFTKKSIRCTRVRRYAGINCIHTHENIHTFVPMYICIYTFVSVSLEAHIQFASFYL